MARKFLGRVIRQTNEGYEWESDNKHPRLIFKGYGPEDCNGVNARMATSEEGEQETVGDQRPDNEPRRGQQVPSGLCEIELSSAGPIGSHGSIVRLSANHIATGSRG